MAGQGNRFVTLAAAAFIFLSWGPASAHDRKTVGAFQFVIGWGEEPAFTGSRNSVVVSVSDAAGPLKETGASLSVEVTFGTERVTLALEPAFGRPHEYRAWLVPTRAGTYAFHVIGKVKDQAIDVSSTCSDRTFDCVAEASDIQFPAKDPSAGQLSDRIDRALPRAELATAAAWRAQAIAVAALAVSVLTAAVAIVLSRRKDRNRV